MSQADLLIEIGTEELPPKALNRLATAFAQGVEEGLKQIHIDFDTVEYYAAPRRLALMVKQLATSQPDQQIEKRGPALQAAFSDDGCPTKAAEGFASSCGVKVEELDTQKTDKGAWLVYRALQKGQASAELLPDIVRHALAKLPIPKRMRWGDRDEEFVRPVHWAVMLHGNDVIDAEILGVKTGRVTHGHRFHHAKPIRLEQAGDYLDALQDTGYVIADIETRREAIRQAVEQTAENLSGRALIDEDLLNEVTSLVEWPVAVAGDFEDRFLEVPAESLISSMQDHQKYFPVVDTEGKLMPHFITISNIESQDPAQVKAGNERVIRPRLSDAAFFWEQDRKNPLETRMDDLDQVVFQQKLGSLGDKTRRVARIAQAIAKQLGVDDGMAHRAGLLSKCDLLTNMVYEFPDLQGIMGRYYAEHDGEAHEVAVALDEQYKPRFAGDELPQTVIGQILAISDKLDTLVGIFAIGQKPSGEKDPFGLRRASLGVLRILIDKGIMLDLHELITLTAETYGKQVDATPVVDEVVDYMMDRLKAFYAEQEIDIDVFDAVLARHPTMPVDFDRRVNAVNEFRKLAEAESLAAANKRIRNILKKVETDINTEVDSSLLQEDAEQKLYKQLITLSDDVESLFNDGDYEAALCKLAVLKEPVDAFFDGVMVMADDENLKNNRVALLNQMSNLFLRAADLSRLQS